MMEGNGDVRELPKGWMFARLDEISESIIDCLHSTPKFDSKGKYCIDTICIEPGKIVFEKVRYVSEEIYRQRTQRLIPKPGAILFSREGTIGTSVIVPDDIELCLGQRMMMFRPASCIIPNFFLCLLTDPLFQKQVKSKITGTTSPHVNIRDLREIFVPIAPLNEQQKIDEKIEELFSELDQGVESLRTAQKQLKVYRQAVLKWAFEGKLTEAWRTQRQSTLKTGEALLAQIKTERENRYQQQLAEWETAVKEWEAIGKVGKKPTKPQKLKELTALTEANISELPKFPKDWCLEKLGNLSELVGGVTKGRDFKGQETISLPYLRVANVQDGYLDLSVIKYIDVLPSELDKYRLSTGQKL